jgi:acyl-CoA synthetase (AMP-forming)/AMP-acid ligase II
MPSGPEELMELPQVIINTLSELLHYSASRWPERVAVADAAGGRALTCRNLDALVTDLIAQLNRHGVGTGDSVALGSDNCLEYVLALFAVVRVRASAAPLNPRLYRWRPGRASCRGEHGYRERWLRWHGQCCFCTDPSRENPPDNPPTHAHARPAPLPP